MEGNKNSPPQAPIRCNGTSRLFSSSFSPVLCHYVPKLTSRIGMNSELAPDPSTGGHIAQPPSAEHSGDDSALPALSAAAPAEPDGDVPSVPNPVHETSGVSLDAQSLSLPNRNHISIEDSNNPDLIQPCETSKERVRVAESRKNNKDWRAKGFASKNDLTHWFPRIAENEHESWRIWMSKRSQALLLHTATVAAILIANFTLTLFALAQYAHRDGVGIIYQGSCSTAKQLDRWLHLLINLLGTGMLMASNYCMQLQAAPTRANVNIAHNNDKWLDIGVSSLRNLTSIGPWRQFSRVFLALSSLPLHLM
ncbi:hypothetical protein ONS96_004589 [Cadophora gregata f. sp. sojae]|nr:hypothetical protein ONS96_004589 [Cadophora gregata f. sp. sojae]